MKSKCPHCGNTNLSEKYTDTFCDNEDPPMYTKCEEVELYDCLECGESAIYAEDVEGINYEPTA